MNNSIKKIILYFTVVIAILLLLLLGSVEYFSTQASSSSISIGDTNLLTNSSDSYFGIITFIRIGFLVLLVLCYLMYKVISNKLTSTIKHLNDKIEVMALGNIPSRDSVDTQEFLEVNSKVNNLIGNLEEVKQFALEVGKGHFDNEVVVFNNSGDLGVALAQMRISLKEISDEDKTRNWTSDGLAKFAEVFRNNNNQSVEELCYIFLKDLIKYISANQGAVFLLEELDGKEVLSMKSSYAYGRRKYQEVVFEKGEGLAGQALLEKEKIFLTEVPKDYFRVTSGLGDSLPQSVLIIPLIINEREVGVLELASLYVMKPSEIYFVEKVAESLAATLINTKVATETKKLLTESQMYAEQLRSQEEEMMQTIEEMNATQEHLQRQSEEMREVQEKLKLEKSMFSVLMEFLPDRLTYKDKESVVIRVNTAKAKRLNTSPEQLIGTSEVDFFPAEHAQKARNEEIELLRVGVPMLNIQEKVSFDDGRVLFNDTSRIPFKNEEGELIGIFIITKDVTQQKLNESTVYKKDKFIKELSNILPMFMYQVDRNGIITDVQYVSGKLSGMNIQSLEKKHISEILPDFYDKTTEMNNTEMLTINSQLEVKGVQVKIAHHILQDNIYNKVYWVLAVKENE